MGSHDHLQEYLLEQSLVFRELNELKTRGWADRDGDAYFQQQRQRADNANEKQRRIFFRMMQQVGDELEETTGAFTRLGPSPLVLDLCMAPGGFSASLLHHRHDAAVRGITLPFQEGGHELLLQRGDKDRRVEAMELDITMLWSGFSKEGIPEDHPEAEKFLLAQHPYEENSFDLIFCDGSVLRTQTRAPYRERKERLRLSCSQLILALQRIKSGGTLILLLHKAEARDTFRLLSRFDGFANIQLFKPKKKHAIRSSFYLIANNVDPHHPAAKDAVREWKHHWEKATLNYRGGGDDEEEADGPSKTSEGAQLSRDTPEAASRLIEEFGPKLIRLAEPVWTIQREALRHAPFTTTTTAAAAAAPSAGAENIQKTASNP